MTFDHNNLEHGIHDHISEPSSSKLVPKVVPLANKTAPSKQELDILFNSLCDEFFTAGTLCVNKSSSPTDNSTQQDTPPLETAQSTTELITPTTTIIVEDNISKENTKCVSAANEELTAAKHKLMLLLMRSEEMSK
nr:hypothetical protein [Tanacetum cinerariifolium]